MLFTATMISLPKKAEAELNHNRDTKKGAEKLIKILRTGTGEQKSKMMNKAIKKAVLY